MCSNLKINQLFKDFRDDNQNQNNIIVIYQ